MSAWADVPAVGHLRTGKFFVCVSKLNKLTASCTLETIKKTTTFLAAITLSLLTAMPAMAACSDAAGPGVGWTRCYLQT
jgi:hypothetical protein